MFFSNIIPLASWRNAPFMGGGRGRGTWGRKGMCDQSVFTYFISRLFVSSCAASSTIISGFRFWGNSKFQGASVPV